MGNARLGLLLLFSTCVLIQSQDLSSTDSEFPCLLSNRYKAFKKYVYEYSAEAENGVTGTSPLTNGPRVTCKVELEVPQVCSFILHTIQCSLVETLVADTQSMPKIQPEATTQAFQAAMEKNSLKFMVEKNDMVKLFPEEDEPTTILNIKRGIISALMVPVEEADNKYMATLHGSCKTVFTVNSRQDIATAVTVERDLSECDHFRPMMDYTSPLALISDLNTPLSKMISSTQSCSYKFDNRRKHMTVGTCTEKHILLPFSSKGKYGMSSTVKQTLTLQDSRKINNRVFNPNEANQKALYMEESRDKAPTQEEDTVLTILKTLSMVSDTHEDMRAALFHQLVSKLRQLQNETLGRVAMEMMAVSNLVTSQALGQCGTPECGSAMMQILRRFEGKALEADVSVYLLGFLSNPNSYLTQDILSMAQYRQSRAIMYGLSNSVRRLYDNDRKVGPVITAVSEFMASLLESDCSGDKDLKFLTLRVLGNMGEAMDAANPGLKTLLLQCVNKPSVDLSVQQAAIQAFRQMTVNEEARHVLLQIALNGAEHLQKRLAAYLIVMRSPEADDIARVIKALPKEQDPQAKSFLASHIANILASNDPLTEGIRQKIKDVLKDSKLPAAKAFTKFSRNYKMGPIQGNVIFDSSGYMPKEIMLETTLKAFGYHLDIFEVGMEGKGFDPSIDALFGNKGFFPDSALKAMYWADDKMPQNVNKVLKDWLPLRNEQSKRQASQSIMYELKQNFIKLMNELKSQQSPEAMMYLRIMGTELGYIKSSDLQDMVFYAHKFVDNMFPKNLHSLLSNLNNGIFAHYIFLDNKFSLSTTAGFPLKFSLSGTLAGGALGSMHFVPRMKEVSFRPSMGVEFVTQMGVHIPHFAVSNIEMHTSIYHNSEFNTKISMTNGQIKLTFPVPLGSNKVFSISNKLLSVTSAGTLTVPSAASGKAVSSTGCHPFIPGMKYCTTLSYPDADFADDVPYFPLTGDSKFAVELQPTGDVTEYTVTISYKNVGQDQKTDILKITLKAEGTQPVEASASLNYDRSKKILSTDIQIPDYNVQAGIRLDVNGCSPRERDTYGFILEVINKDIPQLSLLGCAKLKEMKEGLLKAQLIVPSMDTNAVVSATMTRGAETTLALESSMKASEISSLQKVIFRHDVNRAEIELKSDVNSEIWKLIPDVQDFQNILNDILDQKVAKTDMKLRHIIYKSFEAGHIWVNKAAADIPYVTNLNIPEFNLPSLPEKLFLTSESKFTYKFNKKYVTISIPIPWGGQSSEDLSIPQSITTFSIPPSYDFLLPLFETIEWSATVSNNLYHWESSLSTENDPDKGYFSKYKAVASSPVELLSYTVEGSATFVLYGDPKKISIDMDGSLHNRLLEANFNLKKYRTGTEISTIKTIYVMKASSPLGLETSIYHTSNASTNSVSGDIAEDNSIEGVLKVGPLYVKTAYMYSIIMNIIKEEGRGESTLKIDSTIMQVQNKISGLYTNGELSVISTTGVNNDSLKHKAELNYKDARLTLKSFSGTKAFGVTAQSQAEFVVADDGINVRMESQADGACDCYLLISGFLNQNTLEVTADGAVTIDTHKITHNANLKFDENILKSTSTTKYRNHFMTLDNVFTCDIDDSGTTLSLVSKGNALKIKTESTNTLTLTFSTLAFHSQTDNLYDDATFYKHDIKVDMEPFTASVAMNSDQKLFGVHLSNDGNFKLEPYKMDLTGTLKGVHAEEIIRHTYEVKFADFITKAKFNTNGKILGAQVTHLFDMEVSGLSANLNSESSFNSKPLRITNNIRTLAKPYTITIDALLNSDGELQYGGEHKGELYSKFLFVGEPLSVIYSHDCRASSTHQIARAAPAKTHLDHKMEGQLNTQEQKATWTVKSNMNNNGYNQEISVYNNPERTGIELLGTITTLNENANENQEFSLSGFLKYDKNRDSHVVDIFFIRSLPRILGSLKTTIIHVLESLKQCINNEAINREVTNIYQSVTDYVQDFDSKNMAYIIKEKLLSLSRGHNVTREDVEASLGSLMATIQTIVSDLQVRVKKIVVTVKEIFMIGAWSDSVDDILTKFASELRETDALYKISTTTVSVITSVEDIIKQTDFENLMDGTFDLFLDPAHKDKIKDKLLESLSELKQFIESFDIMQFVADLEEYFFNVRKLLEYLLVNEIPNNILKITSNIKDMIIEFIEDNDIINDMNELLVEIRNDLDQEQIRSDIEKFTNDFTEFVFDLKDNVQEKMNMLESLDFKHTTNRMTEYIDYIVDSLRSFDCCQSTVQIPAFGKLYSQVSLKTPYYNFMTSAEFLNATTTPLSPIFTTSIISKASSVINALEYTMKSTARIAMPKMRRLLISETFNIDHFAFSVDHQGSVSLYGTSAQASAKTTAKATTDPYAAELISNTFFAIESTMTMSVINTYTHNLTIPAIDVSSRAAGSQNIVVKVESESLSLKVDNSGNGKWSVLDLSNEGKHKSEIQFSTDWRTAKLTMTAETNTQDMKIKNTWNAETVMLAYITINGRTEIESSFIKSSVMEVNGRADVQDLIIELNVSENTEVVGNITGTETISVKFLLQPSEFVYDFRYKENVKGILPLGLTAKVNLQNDFFVILNHDVQKMNWVCIARFNQYRYSHNFTMANSRKDAGIYASINGNANLDFLTVPIKIPEFDVPLIGKTPLVENLSLWKHTGLKNILTTTDQSLDIDFRVTYHKQIDEDPIFAIGNLTSDLSFKSSVFTMNANVGLYTHDNIVARFAVMSSSVFDVLKGRIIGTTSLTTKTGVKLANSLTVNHKNFEVTHDSTISHGRKAVEASVTTVAQVSLLLVNLDFNQEFKGYRKSTSKVTSKINLKYRFTVPLIDATGHGNLDHIFGLDGQMTDFSLETVTKGKFDGKMMENIMLTGAGNNEANMFLNDNGLRFMVKTNISSQTSNREHKIWNVNTKQDLTMDATLNHVYVVLKYNGDNEANLLLFDTKGKHELKATVDFSPVTSLKANVDIDMSQSNEDSEASLLQFFVLEIDDNTQRFSWKSREKLFSLFHTCDLLLSSDDKELKINSNSSLEGYDDFLQFIVIPVYWVDLEDIFKIKQDFLDDNHVQFLNISFDSVYTKSRDGFGPDSVSSSMKVFSPVYRSTWTAILENQAPKFIASVESSCNSTVDLLQYDLDATTTAVFQENALALNSKGTFTHSDLNIKWQHMYTHPQSDALHTLNVDVTSPTFTNVNVIYLALQDSISAKISTPSSGTLRFLLKWDTPLRLYGQLYSQDPSTPESNSEILVINASLKNSDKLSLQISWNADPYDKLVQRLKERVPDVISSLYSFADKHHTSLFNMNMEKGAGKLKKFVYRKIQDVYDITDYSMQVISDEKTLRTTIQIYQFLTLLPVSTTSRFLRFYEVQVPGFPEKLSISQLWPKVTKFVSLEMERDIEEVNKHLHRLIDTVFDDVSGVTVTMPYSRRVMTGKHIVDELKLRLVVIQALIISAVENLKSPNEILDNVIEYCENHSKDVEDFFVSLQSNNMKMFADSVTEIATKIWNFCKAKLEEIYEKLNLDNIIHLISSWVDVLVSCLNNLYSHVFYVLQQASNNMPSYVQVSDRNIEIDIPLTFLQ